MKQYTVTWVIEIDAETPQEAAAEALTIHRDPESLATVFKVSDETTSTLVDLSEQDEVV